MIPDVTRICFNNQNMKKVYHGSDLVWPNESRPDISLDWICTGNNSHGNYNVFFYPDYYISRKTRITAYCSFSSDYSLGTQFTLFGTYWNKQNDQRTQVDKYTLSIIKTDQFAKAKFEWGQIYSNATVPVTLITSFVPEDFRSITYLNGINGPNICMSIYDDGWDNYSSITDDTGFSAYNKLLIFKDGDINTVSYCPGGIKLMRLQIEEYIYDPFTPQGVNNRDTEIKHNFVPVLHYADNTWASVAPPTIIHPGNRYYPCLYDTITGAYCYNGGADDPVYQISQ